MGGYDLPERAYSTNTTDNQFRVTENGPLGRRFFSESRLQVHWADTSSQSLVQAPTVRVLDAFTRGGAQQAGVRDVLEFEAASDLDYVRGRHSFRTGLLLEGGRYRTSEEINYLGTYTFASLNAYNLGLPASFTRRVGDPAIGYNNVQVGVYGQDDFRLAKSLMLSYGLRYEAQTLLADQLNFSPRVTMTWSPLKSGKTTFRAGYGRFTDWLGLGTYEQTLRLDGVAPAGSQHHRPGLSQSGHRAARRRRPTGTSSIRASALPESQLANVGVDQMIGMMRLSATYAMRRGTQQLRGRNLNVPVNGVRPDPTFTNVVDVIGDAAQRGSTVTFTGTYINLNWHQTFLAGTYTLSTSETNTTGAFGVPSRGDDLVGEWGPVGPRHRAGASFNTQPIRNLSVAAQLRYQSGSPYNITTGFDTNNDGMFTDRPASVSRNSARSATQWDLGMRVSYAIGFGPRPAAGGAGGPQAVLITIGGGAPGGFGGGANDHRYRVEFYVSAQNVTNHNNYIGYSGVLTSPFFLQPTNVLNPRKLEIGARFGF